MQLPDYVSFEIGATVIHSYVTATTRWRIGRSSRRRDRGRHRRGRRLRHAAVDVAVHLCGLVISSFGSSLHTAALQARSVAAIVDYTRENVRERLSELTGGKGVYVRFYNVGRVIRDARSLYGVARASAADRLRRRRGAEAGDVPAAPVEFFRRRRLRRSLGGQGTRGRASGQVDDHGAGSPPATCVPMSAWSYRSRAGEAMRRSAIAARPARRREGPLAERALGGATPLPQILARSDMEPRSSTLTTANSSLATAS